MDISHDEMLKRNLMRLVEDHRAKCNEQCNVSLGLVYEVALKAGLVFTEEEIRRFM